ncbi:MAG: hypothetical protein ACFCBW_21490 [Candidatus Competibacterales bacterium]
MPQLECQLSGELVGTNVQNLMVQLQHESWRVRDVATDEMMIENDFMSISIYEKNPGEEDGECMMSGSLDGDLEIAKTQLDELVRRFIETEIPYELELALTNDPSQSLSLSRFNY